MEDKFNRLIRSTEATGVQVMNDVNAMLMWLIHKMTPYGYTLFIAMICLYLAQ